MISRLDKQERLSSTTLGDWYPYWWMSEGEVFYANWANEAATALAPAERHLDVVAVLSMLSFGYVCLDRTLLCGVQRVPWMGSVDGEGIPHFQPAPPHGYAIDSPTTIAERLLETLREELSDHCRGAPRIYVLLSGGMDSRVVAAVLRQLQREERITVPIEAVTWGIPRSRDVVYGRRLAERLGWPWHHLTVNENTYWECFETTAVSLGAEVDPKHLHRMTWFDAAQPDAVVIAASYGDSIGRGEYSSQHVSRLKPLEPDDRYRFLKPHVRAWAEPQLRQDIAAIRFRHGRRQESGWLEVERQAHYMRRMLCHPMNIINRTCHLRQAFVTPKVFGLMWSYDFEYRRDSIYGELLRRVDPEMANLPWARTGAVYSHTRPASDSLLKGFHRYGYWLRTCHAKRLEAAVLSGSLESLNVFDMDQVRFMFREWQRERPADDTSLATQLSFLGVLSMFCERFAVTSPLVPGHPTPAGVRDEVLRWLARGSQVVRRVSRPHRLAIAAVTTAGISLLRRSAGETPHPNREP